MGPSGSRLGNPWPWSRSGRSRYECASCRADPTIGRTARNERPPGQAITSPPPISRRSCTPPGRTALPALRVRPVGLVADITYYRTLEGFAHLAVVIGVFSLCAIESFREDRAGAVAGSGARRIPGMPGALAGACLRLHALAPGKRPRPRRRIPGGADPPSAPERRGCWRTRPPPAWPRGPRRKRHRHRRLPALAGRSPSCGGEETTMDRPPRLAPQGPSGPRVSSVPRARLIADLPSPRSRRAVGQLVHVGGEGLGGELEPLGHR